MNNLQPLYDKWSDLKEQAKQDCKEINKSKLQQDFNLAGLNIKWLNYQNDWKKIYLHLSSKLMVMKREKTRYYKIDYDMKFDTKDELELFINSDEEYISLREKVLIVEAIIDYCEKVLDKLKSKQFEIKNWIDWQKFISGN